MAVAGRELTQVQRRFRALGDETRLRLLALLRDGEQCVCDLTDALQMGQSLLSFHLKVLKDAGLVTDRKDGRWLYYTLDPEAREDLAAFVSELKAKQTGLRLAPHVWSLDDIATLAHGGQGRVEGRE